MYRTCLFCNGDLESNEAVERFPVGRRLAFDSAKGRLWVVCRKCWRWNLTPLEERWEAIEACERLYRSTPLRASTDNVGLAKLREGLELVRIGAPQRPEFAAWRYGEVFSRRRARWIVGAVATVSVAIGVQYIGLPLMLGVAGGYPFVWNLPRAIVRVRRRLRVYGRIEQDGTRYAIRGKHLSSAMLVPGGPNEPPELHLNHAGGSAILRSDAASRVLGRIMTGINLKGGSKSEVAGAVRAIEEARDPELYVRSMAARKIQARFERKARHSTGDRGSPAAIAGWSPQDRLALEMSLHEASERDAMEGELANLEDAWKEAEEIAAISDNLLLPEGITEQLKRLRDR